jgi:two-component system sensor histidine kinase MprB
MRAYVRERPLVSLRVRLGLAAGAAVAIAVIAVALSAYASTRAELRSQLDANLTSLSAPLVARASGPPDGAPGGPVDPGRAGGGRRLGSPGIFTVDGDCDAGLGFDDRRGGGFGAASGYVELLGPGGQYCLGPGERVAIAASPAIRRIAATGRGRLLADSHAGGVKLRLLAAGVGSRGAVLVALPLTGVDHTLARELIRLLVILAAGIALAGLLGVLVARTALQPIARFTRQTEAIARRPDRIESERIDEEGGDELARLAATFNSTLDALAASVRAQRDLVADASHELRTPIASIRANIQLLRDESLLSPEDRDAVRDDIIAELDELTSLVGDVVELARGRDRVGAADEVRLDEIVAEALTRARRRAPGLSFDVALEPALVRGDGERMARAVTNLLDNAGKWSPRGGTVEVSLVDGVVTVRDHGPGFESEDLPFVFDRFHRARAARAKPGSGLGLAIVRQAAEAHGGFAEASNAPDGGAVLRVGFGAAMPVPAADVDPPVGRASVPAGSSGRQ